MNISKLRKAALAALALTAVGAATASAASAPAAPSSYTPLASYRILDTRTANQPLKAGIERTVTVTGVPADATAVTVNLTATGATSGGYIVAWPDGAAKPTSGSNVNFAAGQTVANQATVPVTDGKIDVQYAGAGTVQLVVDLEGYYTASAPAYSVPATERFTAPDTPQTISTGGSAKTNATAVGSLTLQPGTYSVTLDAKATPLLTSAVQVFPQFYVYAGEELNAANGFAGDAFNVGAGALESGGNVTIDSYYSGTDVITVTGSAETIYVYAFGYDSDTGAGSYLLDSLTVTAVPVGAVDAAENAS